MFHKNFKWAYFGISWTQEWNTLIVDTITQNIHTYIIAPTYQCTHKLRSVSQSLTHSLTHTLTHSLTHSQTHTQAVDLASLIYPFKLFTHSIYIVTNIIEKECKNKYQACKPAMLYKKLYLAKAYAISGCFVKYHLIPEKCWQWYLLVMISFHIQFLASQLGCSHYNSSFLFPLSMHLISDIFTCRKNLVCLYTALYMVFHSGK